MPLRSTCSELGCKNLQRKAGVLSDGTHRYMKMCHSHATEHLREKAKSELISHEVKPSCYSRPFKIWVDMRRRVNDTTRPFYNRYGGRGISYDPRWDNFELFWKDMGKTYAHNLSLDRIDNDGDYNKENCRWADWTTQMNNRSNAHKLTFNGKTMGISEWARETGIKRTTIKERIRSYGWSVEKTLTTKGRA